MFETKKLQTETLGEYLREIRTGLGLSIVEVTAKTNICERFVEYLESGNYKQLPPDVYVVGFLKQLAAAYEVPVESLLQQFKKERGIAEQVEQKPKQSPRRRWMPEMVLTPKLITALCAVGFVVITMSYLLYQVGVLNRAPSLTIEQPTSGQLVAGSMVTIVGKASPGSTVTIDSQSMYVDSEGHFESTLSVTPGQKTLTVSAKNKFDKVTSKAVGIVVDGPRAADAAQQPLALELVFTKPATIAVTVDDQIMPQEAHDSGQTKTINAQHKILLSTSNAGSIKAVFNGKNLGVLGRDGEILTNLPFTTEVTSLLPMEEQNPSRQQYQ